MVVVAVLGSVSAAGGQSIQEIERVRSERLETEDQLQGLENQLADYENQLSAAREAEQSASARLGELEREMQMRQRLVSTYTQRTRQLENEVVHVGWSRQFRIWWQARGRLQWVTSILDCRRRLGTRLVSWLVHSMT